MKRKRTLILHADEAIPDVKKWLVKKGISREYESVMLVELNGETIWILDKSFLREEWDCDKLVLLGSFDRADLCNINDFIRFEGEKK